MIHRRQIFAVALQAVTDLTTTPLTAIQRSKVKQALTLLSEVKAATTRKLVILDLNKVLVFREWAPRRGGGDAGSVPDPVETLSTNLTTLTVSEAPPPAPAPKRLGEFLVWVRPGLAEFFDKLFSRYDVAIWSSVTQRNITNLASLVLGPRFNDLVFVLSQDSCTSVPGEPGAKPLFKKPLEVVTTSFPYHLDELLLVDDDSAKCVDNPVGTYYNPPSWKPGVDSPGLPELFEEIRSRLD
jgi:hypothetical protein